MSSAARLGGRTFASLRLHRNYRLYWTGQLPSVVGMTMQDTAMPWLGYELTHSAFAVGLIAFFRFIPYAGLGLFAGFVADRFDNRRLLLMLQLVAFATAASLAVLTLTNSVTPWALYALAASSGVAMVFDYPARIALVYQLVPRGELGNAVALSSSLQNSSRIIGPSVAGVLIAAFGVEACFVINAVTFLPYIVALLLIRPTEYFPLRPTTAMPRMWAGMREGLAHLRRSQVVQLILLSSAVITLFGFNYRVLVPVLLSAGLHASPTTFGLLFATFGAGAFTGSIVAATVGSARWQVLLGAQGALGVACLLIAPLHSAIPVGLLLFATGAALTIWQTQSQSALLASSPDALRGRVTGMWMLSLGGLVPLGSLLAGLLADVGGTQLAFAVAGTAGLAITAYAVARVARDPRTRIEHDRDTVDVT